MKKRLQSWIDTPAELAGALDVAAPATDAGLLAEVLATALGAVRQYDCRDWNSAAPAAKAAALFVSVASAQLRDGGLGQRQRQHLFSLANLVLNQALAECDRFAIPIEYAQLSMVGARLIDHSPDVPRAAKFVSSFSYFDRAFETLDLAGDQSSAASDLALVVLDKLMAADDSRVKSQVYGFFVSKAERETETRVLTASDLLLLARVCMVALTPSDPTPLDQASDFARRAYLKALSEDDHEVAARAKLFIGQLFLDLASRPVLLVRASLLEPGAETTDIDERATVEMEAAFAHSVMSRGSDVHAEVCRRLGTQLASKYLEGNDSDPERVKRAQTLLSVAVQLCTGSDRIIAARNLASLKLHLLIRGVQGSHCTVRSAIALALKWALQSSNEALAQSCRELDGAHALFALQSIDDSALPDLLSPRPSHLAGLHYFQMTVDLDSPVDESDRTIFLTADASMSEGKVTVVKTGASLSAHFDAPCAACREPIHFATPLLVDLDTDFDDMSALMRKSFRGTGCLACGNLNRVQVVFALKSTTLGATESIVVPDAWGDHVSDLDKRQLRIVGAIHDAFSDAELPVGAALLPWGDIPKLLAGVSLDISSLERGRHAAVDLLVALVEQRIESAKAILVRNPGIESLLKNSSEEVSRTILLEVERRIGARSFDQRFSMKLGARVLDILKARGISAIGAAFQSLEQSSADAFSNEQFENALEVAMNDGQRRTFLDAYLNHAPRISANRELAVYRTMMLELQHVDWEELTREHADAEADGEVEVGQFKAALLARARRETQDILQRERRLSTAPRALGLLVSALSGTGEFVLFLRPFEVESGVKTHVGPTSDPRIQMRVSSISPRNTSRRLQEEIGHRDDVLAITNAEDWHPANIVSYPEIRGTSDDPVKGFARLNVDDANWRLLAFSLCAAARKILLLLPCAELGNAGIAEELAAIERLSAESRTIVILDAAAGDETFRRTKSGIGQLGFKCILSSTDLDKVNALLRAPSPSSSGVPGASR